MEEQIMYLFGRHGAKDKSGNLVVETIPGFNEDYFTKGKYIDIRTKSIAGSLVARAYDYPNIGLGSFRLSDGFGNPEIFSPKIKGLNAFNGDRSSLAKVGDMDLRNFLANFYEALREYPERSMRGILQNFDENHPIYKKMEEMLPDFELFFRVPYGEYCTIKYGVVETKQGEK